MIKKGALMNLRCSSTIVLKFNNFDDYEKN